MPVRMAIRMTVGVAIGIAISMSIGFGFSVGKRTRSAIRAERQLIHHVRVEFGVIKNPLATIPVELPRFPLPFQGSLGLGMTIEMAVCLNRRGFFDGRNVDNGGLYSDRNRRFSPCGLR